MREERNVDFFSWKMESLFIQSFQRDKWRKKVAFYTFLHHPQRREELLNKKKMKKFVEVFHMHEKLCKQKEKNITQK